LIGRGAVTEANVGQLWLLMIALVGFPMGGAMGQILSATFYAKGNTVTPTKIGILGYTVGIVLKIMAFLTLGLIGIAIGTTLYYFLNVLLMYLLLERELTRELSIASSRI
jgi:peptidoglycan biosynthesis protein MviN/MurJ (putative lipid II flippase)